MIFEKDWRDHWMKNRRIVSKYTMMRAYVSVSSDKSNMQTVSFTADIESQNGQTDRTKIKIFKSKLYCGIVVKKRKFDQSMSWFDKCKRQYRWVKKMETIIWITNSVLYIFLTIWFIVSIFLMFVKRETYIPVIFKIPFEPPSAFRLSGQ